MPYTPPSQQSPALSKNSSPSLSRSGSYSEEGPRSPVSGRPQPPRSNSASYLHKHRRSPSIQKSDSAAPPTPTAEVPDKDVHGADFAQNESVRQSPPPVNNLLIPTGMVISPPDSSENSDGDEEKERGRNEVNWDQLKQAVRAIDMKRESSPDKADVQLSETKSEPVSQTTSPTALSAEARKIAHSRSNTEGTAIIIPRSASFDSPINTSDSDEEDEGPFSKPSLVRKKSGELVKPALRPSSRRRYSSMPGTPTYSKSVHFNDSDNQTRHFLQVDKPMAVSAGSSPVETYDSESEFPFNGETVEREVRITNFPEYTFERKTQPVRVEKIFLSEDKQTLIGVCAVQNIAFHKSVTARFTLDYWKTTSEVTAEYHNEPRSPPTDGCDRFNFQIKLSDQANIDDKTLLVCVRYGVNGQEYWDNNKGTNYHVDFVKTVRKTKPSVVVSGTGARPHSTLPRSRHSPPTSSRGRQESLDDDFSRSFDSSASYSFGNNGKLGLGESGGSIKLKPKSKRGSMFAANDAGQHPANGLGGRYDFGASLSAALSNAQDKLGRQSGLMNRAQKPGSDGSYFGPLDRTEGPAKAQERPDSLTTDRPAMGSDQYRDLVQKFCYFTPGSGKSPRSPQSPESRTSMPKTDGSAESAESPHSSGTSTPSPLLDGSNERASSVLSPFISRSGSPAPATGGGLGARAASPISFGYPYHSSGRDGYLSDSPTPTAIRG